MRSLNWVVLGATVLVLTAPVELWAQGRGHARGKHKAKDRQEVRIERRDGDRDRIFFRESRNGVRDFDRFDDDDDVIVLRDRNGRIIVIDRDDIERRFRVNQRGGGPAFCRSGAGHPVHGRRWCIEKGWGLENRSVFFDDDRVIFRSGDRFVVARARDDRSIFERIADRILFWSD